MMRILIDKKISDKSKSFLLSLGCDLIETVELSFIDNSTSTHPDMQFFSFSNKKAIVFSETLEYYKDKLPDYILYDVPSYGSVYPYDCILNIARVGEKTFLTKFQYENLKNIINFSSPVFTNQGYSKCSICVLNDSAILTADVGVHKIAQKNGVRSYLMNDNGIYLDGYNNGFWGGCSGVLGENKIYFNGNIEMLSCYDGLIEIFKKENIEPLYHTSEKLCDNGSILALDII